MARPALRNGLEAIAPWVREFYGSVRGQMTGVNVTRGNRASIKPRGGGRVVHIGFPTPLAQKMRDGLLEFVEVEGILRQNEDGRTYYVTADDVRVVEEPTLTWRELRGYMPEITEGMTVADYLGPSMVKTDVKRVLMDSSALIAWINGEPAAGRIAGLLDMIARGEVDLVESITVLAEVFKKSKAATQPKRDLQDAKLAAIRAKLESRDVLLLDVTLPVARKATEYRATYGLKLPDATHLATAALNRYDWLVTLDRDFPQLDGLRVLWMKDLLDASIGLPRDMAAQQTFFAADDNVAWLASRPAER